MPSHSRSASKASSGTVDVDVSSTQPPKEGDAVFSDDLDDITVISLRAACLSPTLQPYTRAEVEVTDALKIVPGLRLDYSDA